MHKHAPQYACTLIHLCRQECPGVIKVEMQLSGLFMVSRHFCTPKEMLHTFMYEPLFIQLALLSATPLPGMHAMAALLRKQKGRNCKQSDLSPPSFRLLVCASPQTFQTSCCHPQATANALVGLHTAIGVCCQAKMMHVLLILEHLLTIKDMNSMINFFNFRRFPNSWCNRILRKRLGFIKSIKS